MSEKESGLILLKLGGSLITNKQNPRTPRLEVMQRLAFEIAEARMEHPNLKLIIGHGAGSFAHIPAKKFGTRSGVYTPEQWLGFAEVWWEAAALNRLVMDAFHQAQLPVICLPPSASVITQQGKVLTWDLTPINHALQSELLPVIYGDVIFDTQWGGTVLSTEDLFEYLVLHLFPHRILLAGIEIGVWEDYPQCTRLVPEITPANYAKVIRYLNGSQATDVTGGMLSKVEQNFTLVQKMPGLEILIFSGMKAGNLKSAIAGASSGTVMRA